MDVVVVESPTKASTINKYLGPGYTVVASYGHVRDLLPKDGSVKPDDEFAMNWTVTEGSEKNIRAIVNALKGAKHLYLATDPDREGEAISWHVMDELRRRESLNGIAVKRVVFTEVTKGAVLDAMAHPRDLDDDLIDAYRARRALDYLVGFTLSPVLWRKLPGSRSAGRVQSVALRLICEREAEIEAFKAREYWSVEVTLDTPRDEKLVARLSELDGEKLGKFDLPDQDAAQRAVAAIEAGRYQIATVDAKRTKRNPAPPFTTSTLQQEASRKLGLAARRTMQIAQQLYEGIEVSGERVGLITYMRTDGVQIAAPAIEQVRAVIGRDFGDRYVPSAPRVYKAPAKNAQEAHEAIRPTDLERTPATLESQLNKDQARLYALIWKRTMASQMASAEIDQTTIRIPSDDGRVGLRATGSVIAFDGFLRAYQEGRDDEKADSEAERRLPAVSPGEAMRLSAVAPNQHFTEPPPRYSEASLVKKLEELGIGRPSTYASILSVLQDRDYVRLEKRRFLPEDRGRIVTVFLESFFKRYVEYDFTADLEGQLDSISAGEIDWRHLLHDFWQKFSAAVAETKDLRVSHVLDALDEALGPHLFPPSEDGRDPRRCPSCADGRLNLKLGRYGPFIGCANYPECRYTRPLAGDDAAGGGEPRQLGVDPDTDEPVSLRRGPYGYYVQRGDAEAGGEKPKRVSLPKDQAPDLVDLSAALGLLSLPREVGLHPETGKPITAGIGRFGPYVRHDDIYRSLPRDENVLSIGLNRAVTLIAEAKKRAEAGLLRELGAHPDDGKPVRLREGKFGPYVQHNRIRATLPKGTDADALTLPAALELIAAKAAQGGKQGAKAKPKAKAKPTTKKASAKKAPAKKAATKKAMAKRSGAKTRAKARPAGQVNDDGTADPPTDAETG